MKKNIYADLDINRLIDLFWDQANIAEQQNNFSESIKFLRESLNLIEDHKNDPELYLDINLVTSYLLNDLARLQAESNDLFSAINNYEAAISLALTLGKKSGLQNLYANLGAA